MRVGGHTSCVALTRAGADRPHLVLDAGTGLQVLSAHLGGAPFRGTLLLTHLHWDHAQGLPFFRSGDQPEAEVRLFIPEQGDPRSAVEVMAGAMSPPHFPIRPEGLQGHWTFDELTEGVHELEGLTVQAVELPHKGGTTYGYRVTDPAGGTLAYASDHGPLMLGPGDDGHGPLHESALELARDADVLVHDAQFLASELAIAAEYGHATVDYCYRLAEAAGVGRLVLFHHGPTRTDDEVEAILAAAPEHLHVLVARERETLTV